MKRGWKSGDSNGSAGCEEKRRRAVKSFIGAISIFLKEPASRCIAIHLGSKAALTDKLNANEKAKERVREIYTHRGLLRMMLVKS